jgi:hypothetical protein
VPVGSVLVVPLGECSRAQVDKAVGRQFPGACITLLDRGDLRRRPLRTLVRLLARRFDAAVLVTSDLEQPRLRLTSPVLMLARAGSRWRIDLHGGRERWDPGEHLVREGWAVVRHLLACGLAFAASGLLLRLLEKCVLPRTRAWCEHNSSSGRRDLGPHTQSRRGTRVLYLRSQLWLGLAGGGSVAHTAGVIGGLLAASAEVYAVASDQLAGVCAPTRVVRPEIWFDGWLRELEDLAYNVAFTLEALRVVRAFKPDLVYQRHTAFNVSGAVLSRALGLPLVLEFNSSEM